MQALRDPRRATQVESVGWPRKHPQTSRPGMSRSEVLVVCAAIALVVLPVAAVEWSREIARWYQAAAAELALQDEPAAALARMDRALTWNDQDAALFLQRAQYKMRVQQWQSGLDDCDRARQLEPHNPLVGRLRAELLGSLGRYPEAVAECREMVQASGNALPADRADQLNRLAYTMAVGGVDLPQGLLHADAALRIVSDVAAILDPGGVLCFGRAVTALETNDNQLALSSLSEACAHADAALQAVLRQIQSLGAAMPRRSLALENELQALRSHLAGILQLRVSIYGNLGQGEDAKRDEQRIKELADDGNLSAVLPYDLPAAFARVSGCASILDTRGYLYYKMQVLPAAHQDLQNAVRAMQWLSQAGTWLIDARKNYVSDIRPLLREQQLQKHALAVTLYHRSLVLQALGRQQDAEQDRRRVRDLGYEPGNHLY